MANQKNIKLKKTPAGSPKRTPSGTGGLSRKVTAKKTAVKKPVAKKVAKKPVVKKALAKKPVVKKSAVKKSVAKKAAKAGGKSTPLAKKAVKKSVAGKNISSTKARITKKAVKTQPAAKPQPALKKKPPSSGLSAQSKGKFKKSTFGKSRKKNAAISSAPDDLKPPSSTKGVVLAELRPHHCRWPIGKPLDKNFHFCGETIFGNLSYCVYHAKKAYQMFVTEAGK